MHKIDIIKLYILWFFEDSLHQYPKIGDPIIRFWFYYKNIRYGDDKECLAELKSLPVAKKPRTVGVVEPRVVVKIPWTKIGSSIAKITTGSSSGCNQGMYKYREKTTETFLKFLSSFIFPTRTSRVGKFKIIYIFWIFALWISSFASTVVDILRFSNFSKCKIQTTIFCA